MARTGHAYVFIASFSVPARPDIAGVCIMTATE